MSVRKTIAMSSTEVLTSEPQESSEVPNAEDYLFPHLESLDRMMKLSLVGSAWHQGQDIYGKVKDSNVIVSWMLDTVGNTMHRALSSASPLISMIDRPIKMVDQSFVRTLDKLDISAQHTPGAKLPVLGNTIADVQELPVDPGQDAVTDWNRNTHSLRELSWDKSSEVLSSRYRGLATQGMDTTSYLAKTLLDGFFPANEDAVGVGQVSNKVASRIYRNVSKQVSNLNLIDLQKYISSLISVLQLIRCIATANYRYLNNM